jgi:hypothetical protein
MSSKCLERPSRVQAEAANEAQRGGIEQAKGQWWASRAGLASGFTVPPSGLSGASAVLDAFRDRSMVVAGENRRARDQCADHECQRYDLSCHSVPGWPRCAILVLDTLRPARTLDVSGACSPSSTWKSRVSFAAEAGRSHGNAVPVRSDFPDATCRSADPRHEDGHPTLVVCAIAESKGTSAGDRRIIIAVLEVNRSHER